MKTIKSIKTNKSDTATYMLPSNEAAWAFMRACDAAGLSAGYPSLRSPVTVGGEERSVQVGIKTWMDREVADGLSGSARVIDYEFARE